MMNSKYILFSVVVSTLFLLSACDGESDSNPVLEADLAPLTSDSADNIEKAEGVIYKDEIYANWPED